MTALMLNGAVTNMERLALSIALHNHCTCGRDPVTNVRVALCEGHKAVRDDQFIRRLTFVRRLAERLLADEWIVDPRVDW